VLIIYFRKRQNKVGEAIVFSILLFLTGFSIYSVNVIRSNANPPVNFGRPDNAYSLINYLNREQYPQRPLLKGENFNSPVMEAHDRYSWDYIDGKYRLVKLSANAEYDENTVSLFPRMYSTQPGHPEAYQKWIKIDGKKVRTGQGIINIPTLGDQLEFFFKYQVGYMYLRYFMWNFSGRQNDIQGRGGLLDGNWITGITFLDDLRLPKQENLPTMLRENKARNRYFLVPLILGIIGALFHYRKHRQTFYAVAALFLMAGIGLVIYINEVPVTPRERDYVFVGSFMAFSIWIGLCVFAIYKGLNTIVKSKAVIIISVVAGLLSPVFLISQNYNDHNRSGRFTARDLPANILKSCPPNAILFTNGDNDTYPLLYCQEVENIRTDVRIVIMPFLSANWFINQLRNKKYNDDGLNLSVSQLKYDLNKLDFIPVTDFAKREIGWDEAFRIINSDAGSTKVLLANGDSADFLPSSLLRFNVKQNDSVKSVSVSLKNKKVIYKNDLVFWDILASNASKRPICFTSSNIPENNGLLKYTRSESMDYMLT
ncbi:MAG: hypothetical protein JXR31_12160, partial [Prolixibacteraceae bacterium]|nr:hypothetical protein [Prolixibacteraceae bacterium]